LAPLLLLLIVNSNQIKSSSEVTDILSHRIRADKELMFSCCA